MSSTAFFAEIFPDAVLRRVVLASGVCLALLGVPLILVLPVQPILRAAGVVTWVALAAHELSRARRAWQSCHAMRFSADGAVAVRMPHRGWQSARLLPGGILLRHFGWIRLLVVLPTGEKRVVHELIRGSCRASAEWRRLQVIWRHIGA